MSRLIKHNLRRVDKYNELLLGGAAPYFTSNGNSMNPAEPSGTLDTSLDNYTHFKIVGNDLYLYYTLNRNVVFQASDLAGKGVNDVVDTGAVKSNLSNNSYMFWSQTTGVHTVKRFNLPNHTYAKTNHFLRLKVTDEMYLPKLTAFQYPSYCHLQLDNNTNCLFTLNSALLTSYNGGKPAFITLIESKVANLNQITYVN